MLIRNFIFWLSTKKKLTDAIARRGIKYGFAKRFIAGLTLEECLDASRELNRGGSRVSLNHLGESVTAVEEARRVKDGYLEMTRALAEQRLDGNISVKLTQLGLDTGSGGKELCLALTEEIVASAAAIGRDIEIDMEGSACTDVTIDIFEALRRKHLNVAMAIQAYLFRTEKDLERLAPLRPKIRLVKGAYREPKSIAFQKKSDVDANYCRLLEKLLDGRFFPAIATHDVAMLDHARKLIRERAIPPDRYEMQMIFGIRRDLQQQMREQGHPLRVYVPFGTQWCPYFMRRLSERPANCWFVVRSIFAETGSRAGA
jgi:proline dehydrogenase